MLLRREMAFINAFLKIMRRTSLCKAIDPSVPIQRFIKDFFNILITRSSIVSASSDSHSFNLKRRQRLQSASWSADVLHDDDLFLAVFFGLISLFLVLLDKRTYGLVW